MFENDKISNKKNRSILVCTRGFITDNKTFDVLFQLFKNISCFCFCCCYFCLSLWYYYCLVKNERFINNLVNYVTTTFTISLLPTTSTNMSVSLFIESSWNISI